MLIQIGDVWVDPAEVVSVARLHGAPTMLMRSGPMVSPSTGQTVDEIAAALVPRTAARAIHPLALAVLETGRVSLGDVIGAPEYERAVIAYAAWRTAGCPIWAEGAP